MPVSKVLPLMISKLVARVEMAKSEERESQLAQRTECFVWSVVLMIIFSMMNILTMRRVVVILMIIASVWTMMRIMIMMMIMRMVTAIEFLECPFKVKSVERSQNSAFTLCKVRFFTIPCPKHFHISFFKTNSITIKMSVLPKYATFEMSKLKANTHCTTMK